MLGALILLTVLMFTLAIDHKRNNYLRKIFAILGTVLVLVIGQHMLFSDLHIRAKAKPANISGSHNIIG